MSWKPILALLTVSAVAFPSQALAVEGESNPAPVPTTCTPLKQIYSESRWRERDPSQGLAACPVRTRRGVLNTIRHFREYREYRQITPYRCQPGREGTYAIPCSIVDCESGFDWGAYNPSGAVGVYQLLGWGSPYPARTFSQRLANHRIAAGLSLDNWVCA